MRSRRHRCRWRLTARSPAFSSRCMCLSPEPGPGDRRPPVHGQRPCLHELAGHLPGQARRLPRPLATHRAIGEAHRHFERIRAGDAAPSWVAYFDEPTGPRVPRLHRPWNPPRSCRPSAWPAISGSSTRDPLL